MLYDGIEPHDGGVVTYRVLLDPAKIHRYVERAITNQRQKVKLGPLEIRITKGTPNGGEKAPDQMPEVRKDSPSRILPLRQMRRPNDRITIVVPRKTTAAANTPKGKRA